jgi:hypothetical protein
MENKYYELQESWERVEELLDELAQAGNEFVRAAKNAGAETLAERFRLYFLNGLTNFNEGFSVMFSREDIANGVQEVLDEAEEE